MQADIASVLRTARLGHTLLESVRGTALEVGRLAGPAVIVGPVGYPGAEVLPCQHRGALVQGLTMRSLTGYARGLGLTNGGPLYVRLLAPPGSDLGSGVLAVEEGPNRRLLTVTTLCAHHAIRAARAAQTLPHAVRHAGGATGDELSSVLADMRVDARYDPVLGTTALSWTHRPHPAVISHVDDAVRAAAAACVVEELLLDLRAG
jgi:hypothetical protein